MLELFMKKFLTKIYSKRYSSLPGMITGESPSSRVEKTLFTAGICLSMLLVYTPWATSQLINELSWQDVVKDQPVDWYGTVEAIRIADNVLIYQRNTGGWPKNIPMHKSLSKKDKEKALKDKKKKDDSTIDNGATYLEMIYLSKVYTQTKRQEYKEGLVRGLNYILEAQFPNGGWPQFYPLRKGYYSHITFNDNGMVNMLSTLRDIAENKGKFKIDLDEASRKSAAEAFQKGIELILKTQVKQNGRLTSWCAQYDESKLEPAAARAYELPSLSGYESMNILELLMEIKSPSSELINAIQSGIEWFDKVKITGYKLEKFKNSDGKTDQRLVDDPYAPPLWARFYNLDDNRPFFCDRDGVKKYNLAEIGYERRNGYRWYLTEPQELTGIYEKWKSRWLSIK
jgi:pectinesterase